MNNIVTLGRSFRFSHAHFVLSWARVGALPLSSWIFMRFSLDLESNMFVTMERAFLCHRMAPAVLKGDFDRIGTHY